MMKKLIRNKTGDIPIVVLVLGVFLVCMMALGSFYLFQNRISRTLIGTEVIEKAIATEEKYHFYKNTGKFTDAEIDEVLKIKKDESGNRYIYVEKTSPSGIFREEKITASVKYYIP